jgi:Flp pilus assembly protein TadG
MEIKIREALRDESGSLVLLTFTLFLLLLVSSLAVVDISDNFLAKRQLVEIGEVAITRAAHEISLSRYYAGNILMDNSSADGAQFRIPLDCTSANRVFLSEIATANLRGEAIAVQSWDCSGDEVTATISARIPVLLKLPLGIGSDQNVISSTVGATSVIGGARG